MRPYGLAQLGTRLQQSCGKESVPPRRELLSAIGPGRFHREPVRSELIGQYRHVKKPDFVDFMAPPVSVTDAAKDLDVPD